MRRATASV